MEFVELGEHEFKEIQNNFNNSNFYQTVEWGKIKEKNGWNSNYVGIKKGKNIIAASLLLSKKIFLNFKLFYAPRGYLIDFSDRELITFFTDSVKEFVKKNKGICVKIDPMVVYKDYRNEDKTNDDIYNILCSLKYKHFGFTKGYSKEAQFRWTYVMDVDKEYEQILKGMDQRCRRCIRKFEKYPLITEDVDDNNIKDFKDIMEHTAKRQHHYDRNLEYYKNLSKYLKDRIKLIIIYLDKEKFINENPEHKIISLLNSDSRNLIPISAGVFIFDNDRCNYVYGGTYSDYMSLMAQYKLQMDMICLTKEKNIPLYDFGGISGDFTEGSENYGVYEFKRGFGGYVIEYIGEFDLIVNKVNYYLYKIMYSIYHKFKHILGILRK